MDQGSPRRQRGRHGAAVPLVRAQGPRLAITHSEVLGVVPLEVTDALLREFRRLADRHQRGFMVEQAMELLARS